MSYLKTCKARTVIMKDCPELDVTGLYGLTLHENRFEF